MKHPYRNKPVEDWPEPRPFGDWLGSWFNSESSWPGFLVFVGIVGVITSLVCGGISCARVHEADTEKAVAERDAVLLREISKMSAGPCRDVRLMLEDRSGVACPHPDHTMAAASDKAVRCVCRRK